MSILLSAYACEPGVGSEPGVGWNWVRELDRLGHRVVVITRDNNVEACRRAMESGNGVQFVGCDLGEVARRVKKLPGGIYPYYFAWQIKALLKARRLKRQQQFDVAHHLTFGVFRTPNFLAFSGLPTIFGPVGGGERAPSQLWSMFSFRSRILERLRNIVIWASARNPLLSVAFDRTALILCKTPETKAAIPKRFHPRTAVQFEIGCAEVADAPPERIEGSALRALFVGRLIYWKGPEIALMAVAHARKNGANVVLSFLGRGRELNRLKKLAHALGMESSVQFAPWVSSQEVRRVYSEHHLLLFPSLHDSSGNVVLEALSNGLPVLCLNSGGPPRIIDASCGIAVESENRTTIDVVEGLAAELESFFADEPRRRRMAAAAIVRAKDLSWAKVVQECYSRVDAIRASTKFDLPQLQQSYYDSE